MEGGKRRTATAQNRRDCETRRVYLSRDRNSTGARLYVVFVRGIFSIRVGRAIDEWKESFVAPILINNRSRACRSARNTIRHRSFGSINVEREKILRRPRRTTTLRCSIFHLQEITIIIFLRLRSIYIYICTRDFVTLSIRFSSIKVEIEKKKKERKKDDLEESRRSIFEINDYNDYFFFDYDRSWSFFSFLFFFSSSSDFVSFSILHRFFSKD